jgi:hypothetical protein
MARKAEPKSADFDDTPTLHKLSRAVTKHLLKAIEAGGEDVSPALLAVAAGVLRNQGIVSMPSDPEVEKLRDRMMTSLPFTSDGHERAH